MGEVDASEVLDGDTWARRERFWRELVDTILASVDESKEWPSWEAKFRGDGTTAAGDDSARDGASDLAETVTSSDVPAR